jgi:hypothetical protein
MSTLRDRDPIEPWLRPWLEEEGMVREPDDLLERVATGMQGARQRPGWLVRLMGDGMVGAGAGPAARWREHRMASTLGLGSIVLAAALGIGTLGPGLLTGGGPAAVSDAPSPSASPTVPVAVTGTITGPVQSYGSSWEKDGIGYAVGPWWAITVDASDPRLTGHGTWVANWNESTSTQIGIGASTYVLVSEDGRWVGSGYSTTPMPGRYELVVLRGEGAYDGLTASVLISEDFSSPSSGTTFEGVIFPGEAPTVPEPVEPRAE